MCHSQEEPIAHRKKRRAIKPPAANEELSLTDKAQLVLDWSWEIRDIVSLVSDMGTIILVQHVFSWGIAIGVGSILIGIAVVRLKSRGK